MFSIFSGVLFFKTIDKPSSVVYGHLSTNNVTVIPQRYLLNHFGETPFVKWFVNLASGGVYIAPCVTTQAVRSYRTFSSLPLIKRRLFSVALSLKSPSLGFLQHPVSKTLGLSSLTGSPCPRDRITVLKSKISIQLYFRFVNKFFCKSY